jgi:hypothetical protein
MFNWFKKKEIKQENLCKICQKFKPIDIDVCDELCIFCFRDYVYNHKPVPNQPERSKRENFTRGGHSSNCVEYLNKCFHPAEFKDSCPYKENCEFITPVKMRCSEHCGNTVREVQ